jgi:hypothetical protein
MSKVVFILGAGASRECGAPLMSDFLDIASDLLRSKSAVDKGEEFERVFSAIGALQAVHSKAQLDLNNIESIFTVLELGKVIQRIPGLQLSDIESTISALKDVIVKTLEVTIAFPVKAGRIGIPKPYEAFGNLLKHLLMDAYPIQSASVISFNYDIAADMAIYRAGLGPNYVLEPHNGNPNNVPLLKLHGSLNWATEKQTSKILPLHLNSYFDYYQYDGLEGETTARVPIGSQLARVFLQRYSKEVENEPVIVPPSWNKADYHSALTNVWASAANHLSEAEHIFIIGYSLPETDSFFRHLYALGSVGTAPLRRIAVFNPDASGETRRRFEALLGPGARARYEYYPIGFSDAISKIAEFFPKRKHSQ